MAGIPRGCRLILGINKQGHSANFRRNPEAATAGSQEKLSTEPASLHLPCDGEPAEAEDGNGVAPKAAPG
jgi:hypothetical protein